jgi:hypothetical protein
MPRNHAATGRVISRIAESRRHLALAIATLEAGHPIDPIDTLHIAPALRDALQTMLDVQDELVEAARTNAKRWNNTHVPYEWREAQ